MPTKKKSKLTAAKIEPAGQIAVTTTPVQCNTCGYYAGSGIVGDPCPTCKELLVVAASS